MNKMEKLRKFLIDNGYKGIPTFDCSYTVGDPKRKVYDENGITVLSCCIYDYIEIYGLTYEEYQSLYDILDLYI